MDFETDTPDDEETIQKIIAAAEKVLGQSISEGTSGGITEGTLRYLSERIDEVIASRNLDRAETRGAIGLKAGIFMDFDDDEPDDADKIARLRAAASDILGENL